ncbi:sodium:proton antiporter NhaD [Shinella granuli]|jgi:Na+/H+ antiporter NhaD/arsenite permease-like protein|uniref:Sodium/proton antiporter (NhaD family) n=1 Tax=Shinella granuli TaxID=323621 RepID=A0A4R2CWJ4_SHIGR|nr:sodium:proton antiporter NhaD [Shinella granuli]TCN46078.1 sodium/proton antiporter (NhaD family) [Shinella granuli]
MKRLCRWMSFLAAFVSSYSSVAPAHAEEIAARIDLTHHLAGYLALLIFFIAYGFVAVEKAIQLRKSKPVMLASGLIWALLGLVYALNGQSAALEAAAKHVILDYGELMLFLVVAITYVNTMQERRVFDTLRTRLVSLQLSYRQLFWLVGGLAFVFGPIIDNLTTALVMGAVVVSVGVGNYRFIVMGCIIIVVAANAGGVFSPFGDITSLMVWQKGKLGFFEFFHLFLPSLVNFLVPATFMHFSVPKGTPEATGAVRKLKPGGIVVIWLFVATLVTAVSFKSLFGLPPALGMMLGLGYLQMYSYLLQHIGRRLNNQDMLAFDSLREMRHVEWDTLLFFFGIIFAVAGLGVAGYLAQLSNYLYDDLGATFANIAIGVLGAAFDNIPLMFAVLTMNPDMSSGQWMLVTLSTGVGGSLVSIGSAAGVVLMGLVRNHYTFLNHLRWAWAIGLGYIASILTHLWINAAFI